MNITNITRLFLIIVGSSLLSSNAFGMRAAEDAKILPKPKPGKRNRHNYQSALPEYREDTDFLDTEMNGKDEKNETSAENQSEKDKVRNDQENQSVSMGSAGSTGSCSTDSAVLTLSLLTQHDAKRDAKAVDQNIRYTLIFSSVSEEPLIFLPLASEFSSEINAFLSVVLQKEQEVVVTRTDERELFAALIVKLFKIAPDDVIFDKIVIRRTKRAPFGELASSQD